MWAWEWHLSITVSPNSITDTWSSFKQPHARWNEPPYQGTPRGRGRGTALKRTLTSTRRSSVRVMLSATRLTMEPVHYNDNTPSGRWQVEGVEGSKYRRQVSTTQQTHFINKALGVGCLSTSPLCRRGAPEGGDLSLHFPLNILPPDLLRCLYCPPLTGSFYKSSFYLLCSFEALNWRPSYCGGQFLIKSELL